MEDDDDWEGPSDSEIEAFRKKLEGMSSVPPSASPPPSSDTPTVIPSTAPTNIKEEKYWARPLIAATTGTRDFKIQVGQILLAKPEVFCSPQAPLSTLQKYGLTTSLPPELGPDRIADLLPLILITSTSPFGTSGVLLNRRTGYLLGDLKEEGMGGFCIQPLWFGGTSGGSGMNMVHLAGEEVKGSQKITNDGIYYGGSLEAANTVVTDSSNTLNGFDFKFFVQSTRWLPTQLEGEIKEGMWLMAEVDKRVIFKSRDRQGGKRAKPLWTEVMGLCGECDTFYQSILDEIYKGGS
ncbi:hypothetical protein TrLO_g9342 [Triparma laevis f. longispina]|nr:hypothetical protein TrLO_g9342 [Triparma laevis f. longispina]